MWGDFLIEEEAPEGGRDALIPPKYTNEYKFEGSKEEYASLFLIRISGTFSPPLLGCHI